MKNKLLPKTIYTHRCVCVRVSVHNFSCIVCSLILFILLLCRRNIFWVFFIVSSNNIENIKSIFYCACVYVFSAYVCEILYTFCPFRYARPCVKLNRIKMLCNVKETDFSTLRSGQRSQHVFEHNLNLCLS